MPKLHLHAPKSGPIDLVSSTAEVAYYQALSAHVKHEEAEKREAQRKRSVAMELPEEAAEVHGM
jgi:hypothetical protein